MRSRHFHIALFCALVSLRLTAQPVQSPVKNVSSAGAVTGNAHPSTTVPTHFSVIGQPVFSPRNVSTSNGVGILNVNEIMFSTLIPAVTVSGFSPLSGPVGTQVTLTGANFSTTPANNVVKFNNTDANVTSSTATSITTTVPTGATTGRISVTVSGVTGTSSTDFVVLARIITEDLPASYDIGSTITASIIVDDPSKLSSVIFKSRGISGDPAVESSTSVSPSLNTYQFQIPANQLTDEIGTRYYFQLNHPNSTTSTSTIRYAYVSHPSTQSNTIPGLSFGSKLSNYQLIAVPFVLADKNVPSVFEALMPYDKTKWRMFRYVNGKNREYPEFTTIEHGRGYWLIVRNQTDIDIGGGQVPNLTESEPFTLVLQPGWNLIGNPYNFPISWTDVLNANGNPASINTHVRLFTGGSLLNGDQIDEFRGAFIKNNETSVVNLDVPVRRNTNLGRMRYNHVTNALDQSHWEVPLIVKENDLRNEVGGIGMHPEADAGEDRFDEASIPFPEDMGFPSLQVQAQGGALLSKSVVNTMDNFTWQFDLSRHANNTVLEIEWSSEYFGNGDKNLMLFEPASGDLVNMRNVNRFETKPDSRKLIFLFGSEEYVQEFLDAQLPWLGEPYPNPSRHEVRVPFRIPAKWHNQKVKVALFDARGAELVPLVDRVLSKGNYELTWYPENRSSLYLLRMTIGDQEVIVRKVILH